MFDAYNIRRICRSFVLTSFASRDKWVILKLTTEQIWAAGISPSFNVFVATRIRPTNTRGRTLCSLWGCIRVRHFQFCIISSREIEQLYQRNFPFVIDFGKVYSIHNLCDDIKKIFCFQWNNAIKLIAVFGDSIVFASKCCIFQSHCMDACHNRAVKCKKNDN